jgi:chondroitin AC lyase
MWWMLFDVLAASFAFQPDLQALSQSLGPFLEREAAQSGVLWSQEFDMVEPDGRIKGWTYQEGHQWMKHVERADTMVQALFADRASEAIRQDRVKKILRMLQLLLKEELEIKRLCAKNWYYLQIGIPRPLARILLLLKQDMEAHERHYFVGWLPWMHHQPKWAFSGANLVWIAWIQIYKSVLTQELGWLKESLKALRDLVLVQDPGQEGIQQDGSLHQHGSYIYNGAYGHYLLSEVARFAAWTAETSSALPISAIQLLLDTLESTILMGRKGRFCPSVLGREIIRGIRGMHDLTQICDTLAALLPNTHPSKENICERIKKFTTFHLNPIPELNVAKHFWRSGYTVLHRPAWSVTVRSTAEPFIGTEAGNGENKLGFWLPFGLALQYKSGREYDHLLPLWDWAHLPGVTNPERVPLLQQGNVGWEHVSQKGAFSGGVHLWQYACHAFDLEQALITQEHPHKRVTAPISMSAKKSFFGFQSWAVFMGTGIRSTDEKRVVTTLDQRFAQPVFYQQQVFNQPVQKRGNVSFLKVGEMGYLFPQQQTLEFKIEDRVPKPFDLGPRIYDDGAQKSRVLWLGLDHGVKPTSESYVWMQSPGLELDQLKQLAEKPPIHIARMDEEVHALWDPSEHVYMMSCFKPCSVSFSPNLEVSLSERSLLIMKQEGEGFKLRVSSPDPKVSKMEIQIRFQGISRKGVFETGKGRWLGAPQSLKEFEVFGVSDS